MTVIYQFDESGFVIARDAEKHNKDVWRYCLRQHCIGRKIPNIKELVISTAEDTIRVTWPGNLIVLSMEGKLVKHNRRMMFRRPGKR